MKKFCRTIISLFISTTCVLTCTQASASDFNLPFINAAQLGNAYSGWAADAEDASTAYSNPAGLVRIHNQQLVGSYLQLLGSTHFNGTTTPPFPPFEPQHGKSRSRLFGPLPTFFYALPINNCVVVAFGANNPFALGTTYSSHSIVRYFNTRSQLLTYDAGPSIGVKINECLSAGLGLDVERFSFKFNNAIGVPPFLPDSFSHNDIAGWGVGWHSGLLYQFNRGTRVGLNFASQVSFHMNGDSRILSPFIPNENNTLTSHNVKTRARLPALTQLSLHHDFDCHWSMMGTVFYSNWRSFNRLTVKNIIIPTGDNITILLPLNYHNTFDYAVGVNYKPSEKWILRSGLQLLNSAVSSANRVVADPIGKATIVTVGAHYQQNCRLGYDIGYGHSFFHKVPVSHDTPSNTAFGHILSYSNVIGGQVTWNIV